MALDQLATFTDREEAIALFQLLRGHDRDKPWPLLPILAFLASGGSGKSLLLKRLRVRECSLPDGSAALPYAYLDFTLPHTPKDLLSILIALRDQLQQHDDGLEKHLTFPRFDLGALMARGALAGEDPDSLTPNHVRSKLSEGKHFFESLTALSSTLGHAVPFIPVLMAGLNVAGQIKPVNEILNYLEDSTGWKWYREHGSETALGANARLKDVMNRLYNWSMPGKPEREYVIGHLLPEAFLADLLDALVQSNPPRAWSRDANVVLFFDGFEELLSGPGKDNTAIQLLEALMLSSHRERGETDPLLLVVGSRQSPVEITTTDQHSIARLSTMQDEPRISVRDLYQNWQQQLPVERAYLRLQDLCLLFYLDDFGPDDTQNYLSHFSVKGQRVADDKRLVEALHQVTSGHPLSLALATAALLEARAHDQDLKPGDFLKSSVSRKVVAGHEHERVEVYLLDLFMRQLSEAERDEMIYCAAPRFLSSAILQAIRPLSSDREERKRWERYRHLTFARTIDEHHMAFHPIVRTLLLNQLIPSHEPESGFYQTHSRLRDYFQGLASRQTSSVEQEVDVKQASIEEAYHTLALGDPELAVELALFAQSRNLTLWEPLLEAVKQASTALMPGDAEQQANAALKQAQQHHYARDAVTSLVLYTWLLSASRESPVNAARIENNLGIAYRNLPGGDREANLRQAIACYEAALEIFYSARMDFYAQVVSSNLESARSRLQQLGEV